MIGVDASTGRALDGMQHLGQSIGDILMTPMGSRVMRRDYGSLLTELIDQPIYNATLFGGLSAPLTFSATDPRLTPQARARLAELGNNQKVIDSDGFGIMPDDLKGNF